MVVRVTAPSLRDVVIDRNGNVIKRKEEDDELTTLAEYWTLGRAGDRWILHSIEQDAEGAHHLDAPIVASPWSDDSRLHDDALTELAVADAVPDPRSAGRRRRLRRRRAHAGARPLGGRRSLRPRGAGGRRPAGGRGVGRGGRRRRRRARARGDAGGGARAAVPARQNTRLVVRGPRLPRLRSSRSTPQAQPPTFTVEAVSTAGAARGPRHRGRAEGRRIAPRRSPSAGRSRSATTPPRRGGSSRPPRWATLLLAVPNVSEGRDAATLDAIGAAFSPAARGCSTSTPTPTTTAPCSRSRASRARSPGAAGGRARGGRADRPSEHAGVHPRVGALDVAPIVHRGDAGRGAAVAEALLLAHRLGRDLGLPVYLYGALAGGRARASLRAPAALAGLAPDYGPPRLHPTAGATLVAARPPLVAFNVELAAPATLDDARAIAAASARAGRRGCPACARSGCSSPAAASSRSRPTSRTRASPPPTSSPPSPATPRSRRRARRARPGRGARRPRGPAAQPPHPEDHLDS